MQGEDVIFRTGDPVVDKWEEQIARGEDPDIDADLTEEDQRIIEALSSKSNQESFRDDYTAVEVNQSQPKSGITPFFSDNPDAPE